MTSNWKYYIPKLSSAILVLLGVILLTTTTAYAATQSLGDVSNTITGSVSLMARFLTAASYVVGFGFGVGALVKYKAHRDNPMQVPLSHVVFLAFMALLLIFMPLLFSIAEQSAFGTGTQTGPQGATQVK